MPAFRFFHVYRRGKDVEYKRQSQMLYELCDVVALVHANRSQHIVDLKTMYYQRANPPENRQLPMQKEVEAFPPENVETRNAVSSFFARGHH